MKLIAVFLLVGASVFCSLETVKAEGKVKNTIQSGISNLDIFN